MLPCPVCLLYAAPMAVPGTQDGPKKVTRDVERAEVPGMPDGGGQGVGRIASSPLPTLLPTCYPVARGVERTEEHCHSQLCVRPCPNSQVHRQLKAHPLWHARQDDAHSVMHRCKQGVTAAALCARALRGNSARKREAFLGRSLSVYSQVAMRNHWLTAVELHHPLAAQPCFCSVWHCTVYVLLQAGATDPSAARNML